jgi:NDP-sugar pyrophosphorylase family protein
MRHHRQRSRSPAWGAGTPLTADPLDARIVLVGAGPLATELLALAAQAGWEPAGILDPDPETKGTFISDVPVLGWLSAWPRHPCAAMIGLPARSGAFDRAAVFHLLAQRGIQFPILVAATARCAPGVQLHRGISLLDEATILSDARLGENCIVGRGITINRYADVSPHRVVSQRLHGNRSDGQPLTSTATAAIVHHFARANEPIQEVMRRMSACTPPVALIVDDQGMLRGTVTDGDIRRGILANIGLNEPVAQVMNPSPVTGRPTFTRAEMLDLMRSRSIRHLPIVDATGRPVRIEVREELSDALDTGNAVVMAGGLGSRLRPLTENLPKPLLPVAGRPILDHILDGLRAGGFRDVVISINYLGERIAEHIGDGARHGVNVNYVSEKERLGTAGALSLLSPRPSRPFLVMNGDLLTGIDFRRLLDFSREGRYDMVVAVRSYQIDVPYGVVDVRDGQVAGLREKPSYRHFINAGIYLLTPACMDFIPAGRFFDMTDLINALLAKGRTVGAFPVVEYWRDIGNVSDLQQATRDKLAETGARPAPRAMAEATEALRL